MPCIGAPPPLPCLPKEVSLSLNFVLISHLTFKTNTWFNLSHGRVDFQQQVLSAPALVLLKSSARPEFRPRRKEGRDEKAKGGEEEGGQGRRRRKAEGGRGQAEAGWHAWAGVGVSLTSCCAGLDSGRDHGGLLRGRLRDLGVSGGGGAATWRQERVVGRGPAPLPGALLPGRGPAPGPGPPARSLAPRYSYHRFLATLWEEKHRYSEKAPAHQRAGLIAMAQDLNSPLF